MTGRRVVLLGLIAVLSYAAGGCWASPSELAATRTALAAAQSELVQARASLAATQAELADVNAKTAELQKAVDRLRASVEFLKRKWKAAEANAARLAKENAELRKPTSRPQK